MKNNLKKNKILEEIDRDQREIARLTQQIDLLNLNVKAAIERLTQVDASETADSTLDFDDELSEVIITTEESVRGNANSRERDPNKIILVESLSGDIQKGDKVRVTNHYKIRVVKTIGKTFIFFDVEGIPVTQQRTEANLELVNTKVLMTSNEHEWC